MALSKKDMEFSAPAKSECEELLARYPRPEGALLPVLHLAMREWGHIPTEAVVYLSNLLGVAPARLEGAISFYPAFRTQPAGRHLIGVCCTLSCSLMGATEVETYLCEKLGVEVGQTTADGHFTLTKMECLASCGTAPVMLVNGELHQSLTRAKIDQILERLT